MARTDDWFIKRFILARNRDTKAAFEMLHETMKWRRDLFVAEVRDFHFPSEFYKIGALFTYEPDREGNLVLYMRIRMHKKISELEEPTKGFLVHNFNKAERIARGNGFVIVFDLNGAGLGQLDLPFLNFLVTFGRNHFPGSLSYILVFNLPWVLSAFQKVAFAMLPQEMVEKIRFARGKEIFDYIAPENVPDYIDGGKCKRNFRAIAPACQPIMSLLTGYGYSQADYDRIIPSFQKDLDEADRALATNTYQDPPAFFFDSVDGVEITPLPLPSQRVHKKKNDSLQVKQTSVSDETDAKRLKKSIDTLLSITPSNTITFVHEAGSLLGEFDAKNLTSKPVAFKVQSNNPSSYSVSPRLGILLPNASLRFTVKLLTQADCLLKDKFLVVALPLPDNVTTMSAAQFYKLWLEQSSNVHSYKLTGFVVQETVCSEVDGTQQEQVKDESFGLQVKRLVKKIGRLEASQSRLWLLVTLLVLMVGFLLTVLVADEFYQIKLGRLLAKASIPSLFEKVLAVKNEASGKSRT